MQIAQFDINWTSIEAQLSLQMIQQQSSCFSNENPFAIIIIESVYWLSNQEVLILKVNYITSTMTWMPENEFDENKKAFTVIK